MTPKPKPLLCVVAGQRSGSTALRSALVATLKFRNFREVFQEGTPDKPGIFRQFAEAQALPLSDMTSVSRVDAIINDFLDYLQSQSKIRVPVMDIKQNSWNALRPFWSYSLDEPLLMRRLRQRGTTFLFLARRDLTAQIVSERIAEATGRWHDLTPQDLKGPVRVDKTEALRKARLILDNEKLLLRHLGASDRMLPVWYEDLFQDGAVNPAVTGWLSQRLGIDLSGPLRPLISRNQVEKSEVVADYAELRRAIDGLIQAEGRIVLPALPGAPLGAGQPIR